MDLGALEKRVIKDTKTDIINNLIEEAQLNELHTQTSWKCYIYSTGIRVIM